MNLVQYNNIYIPSPFLDTILCFLSIFLLNLFPNCLFLDPVLTQALLPITINFKCYFSNEQLSFRQFLT